MTAKEIIEKICKDNSLTLRQLAELAGIKEQSLYDIKSDRVKKVSEINAEKIAAVFPKYPLMWLMTGNEAFLNQRGTEIKIVNSNGGHNNTNIGSGTQTNGTDNAEMWKRLLAEKDAQIAELKADKEKLYQLLLKQ